MLIKALFHFYRREDTLCERSLEVVETGSAPGRLVPVIRAMVREKTGENPNENTRALMAQITGNRKELEKNCRISDRRSPRES